MKKYKIAVLDDYQNVALESADWSVLRDRAYIAAPDIEPLPPSHPFRTLDNVLATPHIGYVFAWSLQDVLRGYRLEYSEVARHPLRTVATR